MKDFESAMTVIFVTVFVTCISAVMIKCTKHVLLYDPGSVKKENCKK